MSETPMLPSREVAEELREVLRRNQSRLGDTFRGLEAGQTHRQIADELGVPTHGFGYNNQATIEAILEGRRSPSPVPTRVMRSRVSSLLQHAKLSAAARDYLVEVVADLDSMGNPAHDWDNFVRWAALFAESTDLGVSEDSWKRDSAARLARAREQLLAGEPGAHDNVRSELAKSGLLDKFFVMQLADAVKSSPVDFAVAISTFWKEDPEEADINRLADSLRSVLGRLTPGNATSLAGLLLMTRDPGKYPPYRPSPVVTLRRLTGDEGGQPDSPEARYRQLLDWLDCFIAEAAERDLVLRDRLAAQGLAWTVAKTDPVATGWPEDLANEFARWRGDAPEPPRAWLMRPAQGGPESWLTQGYVGMAATYLGEVEPGSDLKMVKGAVEAGYNHLDYAQRKALATEYFAFLSSMKPGDPVVVQADTEVNIGVVVSDPEYSEGTGDRLRREVVWETAVDSVSLPATLAGLLDLQGNVIDITSGLEALDLLVVEPPEDGHDGELTLPPPPDAIPTLAPVRAELVSRLHMAHEYLQEIVDLLQTRQQVVLYGPPGTGKTFLAMALARHIVGPGDRSRVQLVQFHPSYAYEDFFEGYRPTETEQGQATFELKPGPLRRIAADAREHPDEPYVLVIDELNRANLAKVFGELYFLLEYRNESIQLQYQPTEAFRLPRNLFLIGTMNTADRSIALLDSAMRRRFSFIELHPDVPPVRDVLANWLIANHQSSERAELLTALNAAIEDQDRDLRIGPSYLMRPEASTDEGLGRVWRYDIMPLLEEHYYGRLTRDQLQARFGLHALRAGLAGAEALGSSADQSGSDVAGLTGQDELFNDSH